MQLSDPSLLHVGKSPCLTAVTTGLTNVYACCYVQSLGGLETVLMACSQLRFWAAPNAMHRFPPRATQAYAGGCNLDAPPESVRSVQQHASRPSLVSQPETSQPTPTQSQWESIKAMACRVSMAVDWASSEAYHQPSGPNLESIARLFLIQILAELLYRIIYVHALNQKLDMMPILR